MAIHTELAIYKVAYALFDAITELTHDGHLFEAYKCGEQDAEFIARAQEFGHEEEYAKAILL